MFLLRCSINAVDEWDCRLGLLPGSDAGLELFRHSKPDRPVQNLIRTPRSIVRGTS